MAIRQYEHGARLIDDVGRQIEHVEDRQRVREPEVEVFVEDPREQARGEDDVLHRHAAVLAGEAREHEPAGVAYALARGRPKAVASVYGVPMDEIDARYREWLRLTW